MRTQVMLDARIAPGVRPMFLCEALAADGRAPGAGRPSRRRSSVVARWPEQAVEEGVRYLAVVQTQRP